MKYAIVIPDGAADVALDELDGKTPLEAANIPNMDWIAANGKCGSVANVPADMPCGSDVAILSVLGYDPTKVYTGRAPLEAAAQGIRIPPGQFVFRCNVVTIVDGVMEDHAAGHIATEEAWALIEALRDATNDEEIGFYRGVSYRHLVTIKDPAGQAVTTPPHAILGQPVQKHMPKGPGSDVLCELIERSWTLFPQHEINTVRRDLGENPATGIWLWGQGTMPRLEPFEARYGKSAAVITAVDLVRGIARLIGWPCIDVEGATGYVDTNYAGKGAAAVAALDDVDMIVVHVEAPDEAAHGADPAAKVRAIEQIDEHIVAALLERLKAEGDDWRILVLPDHPTPCTVRDHTHDPVPFAMAGKDVASILTAPFTEDSAANSDLHIARGCDMMEYFLAPR